MKIESKDVTGANTLTPTFTERTISGTARVQNNRTMMLASVSTEVQADGRSGLPFLSGLPILGRFFTSPTKDNRQVDIVIAVTPRVLRAPAVTPRDEEMRPSGTLQSPTTGSLEAMLREGEREDQIAAAKTAKARVPAAPVAEEAPAYVPASNTNTSTDQSVQFTLLATNDVAAPGTNQTSTQNAAAKNNAGADNTVPPPKAASFAPQTGSNSNSKMDVATAIKNVVTPSTTLTNTADTAKPQPNVTAPMEDLAPKSAAVDTTAITSAPLPKVIELRLNPAKSELTMGEKRQFAIELNSEASLGLAVVMLRFDPNVLKVNSVSTGKMFAGAKTVPTLTQSLDQKGVLLVSVAPAAGTQISGEGEFLNLEVEAIGAGDSSVAFDVSNVHLVSADGQSTVLQLAPMSLTVRPAAAPVTKPASEETSSVAAPAAVQAGI